MKALSRSQLQIAYDLIKQRRFAEARPILAEVLSHDPHNIDAWWLAAHAAESVKQKRTALRQVIQLSPDHEQAKQLLRDMDDYEAPPPAPIITDHEEIQIAAKKRSRRKIHWLFVVMATIGILGLLTVPILVLDNFVGAGLVRSIETKLFGEPEASGWVWVKGGGQAREDSSRESRIPITFEKEITDSQMQFGVLLQGEAHRYDFRAPGGNVILATAIFTNGGNADVVTLELWNLSGRLVATESDFDMTSRARVLQYEVTESQQMSVVLVGRENGAAGNYTFIIERVKLDPVTVQPVITPSGQN